MGFGVDAHSMLISAANGHEAVRFASPGSLEEYVAGKAPKKTPVPAQAALEEAFFLSLRLNRGVNLESIAKEFGHAATDGFSDTISDCVGSGLLERSGDVIRLTPRGRLLSNEVFERFILDATPCGRTLLSAAFEVDADFEVGSTSWAAEPRLEPKSKAADKSVRPTFSSGNFRPPKLLCSNSAFEGSPPLNGDSPVDFQLNDEQLQLKKSVREFAEREIAPHVMEWDEAGDFPLATVKELGKLGLLGIVFPPEYGGAGWATSNMSSPSKSFRAWTARSASSLPRIILSARITFSLPATRRRSRNT